MNNQLVADFSATLNLSACFLAGGGVVASISLALLRTTEVLIDAYQRSLKSPLNGGEGDEGGSR